MPAKKNPSKKKPSQKLIFSNDFYSDIEMDGMLYGVIVRSPFSTGIIKDVSIPELPDGCFLFTAADIPGTNTIQTLDVQTPVFCNGHIKYKGEPIGILVGPDENRLHDLLADVQIMLDSSTIKSAVKSFENLYDHPSIALPGDKPIPPETELKEPDSADSVENTVLFRRSIRTGAALEQPYDGVNPFDSLFSEADYVIEDTWLSTIHNSSCAETNGAVALMKGGSLLLYTPTQWLCHLRKTVSAVADYNPDKILVCRTNSSRLNTNTLWRNAVLSSQICVAVRKTGKPVKLMFSRQEQDRFMENMAPVRIKHHTAVMKDGTITAMQISIDMDAGAWNPFASEILDRLVIAACGIYNPQNLKIDAVAHRSANPPSSVDLSTIDASAFFAVENQIQKIADRTGISPVELRLKNIRTTPSQTTSMPFLFSPGNVAQTINAVCEKSDFNRKYTIYRLEQGNRYTDANDSPFAPPLRGIGIACAFEGSGYFGTNIYSGNQSLEVTFTSEQTLEIKTMPLSGSIKKIWTRIASEILSIAPDAVHLNSSFDQESEPQLPESIVSNISIMTLLLRKCCEAVRTKKNKMPLPLTIKKSITPAMKKGWHNDLFSGTPFHSTSFGTAVMELELDPCTFRENIRGIWIAVDGGKILNSKAAETSVKLGIQQTLSQFVENDILHCPVNSVQFIPSESDPKQIGDLVASILPAAYLSALSQAVASTMNTLPLHTDSVYRQICTEQNSKKIQEVQEETAE